MLCDWLHLPGGKMIPWFVFLSAFLLGVLPIVHHFLFGLPERKREILDFFDDDAITAYFERYYHSDMPQLIQSPREELNKIYRGRFGVRTFFLPLLIYLAALALSVGTICETIFGPLSNIAFPAVATTPIVAYALAGAYLWVISDLIIRYRQRNILPSTLYAAAFRFAIAVPIALAVQAIVEAFPGKHDTVSATFAFLLGTFPTDTLLLFLRRHTAKWLGLTDDSQIQINELEVLQGINTALAERLSDIGVKTFLQLAYEDPIQLSMRTNLPFCFVLDIVSQALVALYFSELRGPPERPEYFGIKTAQKYVIRGAIEASNLYRDLRSRTPATRARAEAVLEGIRTELQIAADVVRTRLYEIDGDPQTEFMRGMPF
jgi:hypothetical protein